MWDHDSQSLKNFLKQTNKKNLMHTEKKRFEQSWFEVNDI